MLLQVLLICLTISTTLNGQEFYKLQETKELILKFFDFFHIHDKQLTVPSVDELEQFFSPNFKVISNGEQVCKNTEEYRHHFVDLRKNFTKIVCSELLDEPIISENKIVIRYNADTTSLSGSQMRYQIIAILTFDQGKISSWIEVLNENKSIYWNSF